eukprot:2640528-Pyramimonas_sp.AAC.1
MDRTFGPPASWSDSVRALNKAVWTGEHDAEIAKLASTMPSSLDAIQIERRLAESFQPMVHLVALHQTETQ